MGTLFLGNCESCCGKDNHDLESDNNPTLFKKKIRFSPPCQNNYMKKIYISSSSTNFNNISNSAISERAEISMSLDNTPVKSNKRDIISLLSNLISFQIYEKMIKGERLHNILEPLAFYENNFLFELLLVILVKIKDIFKNEFFGENVVNFHKNFLKKIQELNNNNILQDIKLNIEEDSRLKYILLDVIESVVELFHFFKYKIVDGQEPYNKCYWDQYKDCISYIEQKLNEIKSSIININLSLGDNKLKIID